jgi:transposase-like protein
MIDKQHSTAYTINKQVNIKGGIVMFCPDCKIKMGKAGFAWSGKNKVQRYRCNKCGKTTTKEK